MEMEMAFLYTEAGIKAQCKELGIVKIYLSRSQAVTGSGGRVGKGDRQYGNLDIRNITVAGGTEQTLLWLSFCQ